jgi:hypothetical protein
LLKKYHSALDLIASMPAQKRALYESSAQNPKKSRKNDSAKTTNSFLTEEVDFPRGGGTSFTPLEVKAIRAEAVQEANAELFKVSQFLLSKRYLNDLFLFRILTKVFRRAKKENAKLKSNLSVQQKERIGSGLNT